MTREEAIELLEDLDGAVEDSHGRDYDEAFRMAVKALRMNSVPIGIYEMCLAERDIAIQGLEDHGLSFSEVYSEYLEQESKK